MAKYYEDENGEAEEDPYYEEDAICAAEDYQEDSGPQFYVNPNGMCEDAPCCGCCGYH